MRSGGRGRGGHGAGENPVGSSKYEGMPVLRGTLEIFPVELLV